MINRWLNANEIAELLRTTGRTVRRLAEEGRWDVREFTVRGGKEKRFNISSMSEKIQMAYAASIKISFPELQKELEPGLIFNKKVVINRYNGSGKPRKESKTFTQVCKKGREKAHLKAKIINAWSASGLSHEEFSALYNTNQVIPEIRQANKNKTVSASTLYRWMQDYTAGGEDGLVPRYAGKRGGHGASLDERIKGHIWFYYLHKNKPAAARVIRLLKEKDNIEVNRAMVYRYIKHEIPQAVKIYFREGPKAYKDKCEVYMNIDYTKLYSMQWVVYDHKTFDFASRVKKADGWHRVRLSLTCVIDKRSRKILGYWIDEVPSTLTIIRATRMMVEKYGCPDGAQTDNGKDFAGYWFAGNAWNEQHIKYCAKEKRIVSSVLEDLGMAISYTTPYHAQAKNIERLFGFIALEFDKSFESYLGSNTSDRHEQSRLYLGNWEGAAARPIEELPTLEETRLLFEKFVEWYNTQWKHSGQGMNNKTPDTVFAENLRGKRTIPAEYEKYVWTRREIKKVQQNGVKSEDNWYYNDAMIAIIGQEVELRINIDDIGEGYIFNLQGEYLFDAASDLKDSGITEENVRTVKRLRRQGKRHLEKYNNAINEIGKDKKTQLEELREAEAAALANFELKVVGGNPLSDTGKPVSKTGQALKLVKAKKQKEKKVIGILDIT